MHPAVLPNKLLNWSITIRGGKAFVLVGACGLCVMPKSAAVTPEPVSPSGKMLEKRPKLSRTSRIDDGVKIRVQLAIALMLLRSE